MNKITEFPRKSGRQAKKQVNTIKHGAPKRDNNSKSGFKDKMISILLIVAVVYFAFLIIDQGIKYYQLVQQREDLKTEIEQAEQEKKELEEEVEQLRDPQYIEILARRKFGLIRESDILLEIPLEEE
ncbi:cell division protein FtsL [Natranaerobius thermophilus]|uniref:Cell division protein FtsL n=1 Tax=Natranaerobius thermophilus (strain ATCC BAA-1301 / DSM 18059 / JW/NM-WN-LF) TaxID=457570 RepID=B2A3P7_NATTJ|nr:cell division protein FtsL [Natranaerobius thermophilus]ACB83673.1 cell division protein FtsL [Natranaerobius thermophilus JW/NM-WN-LF]